MALQRTFSHGFLILPISLWLAWRNRDAWRATAWGPSWSGALAVLALVALLGGRARQRGAGVEQFAVVAMIPALVLAVFGWPATSVLIFPLRSCLFLAVPFGRALVPFLMQVTADLATLALQWTGVPVLAVAHVHQHSVRQLRGRPGLQRAQLLHHQPRARRPLRLPEVLGLAQAAAVRCWRSWSSRSIANGLRVYFTILVSHLTDMRFGPGTEHVTFGRVFFVLVVMLVDVLDRTALARRRAAGSGHDRIPSSLRTARAERRCGRCAARGVADRWRARTICRPSSAPPRRNWPMRVELA